MSRARLLLAFLLLLPLAAHAQQGVPRIAVIPLNPIGASAAEAAAFTDLLDTGLVKTASFNVLAQRDASAILDAQGESLRDCTDETCAIKIGKLLAAESIVLGSLSAVGGKSILNARIIDVTTGRTLRADTVEAPSIAELTKQVDLLAFKLAGLTYQSGGEERVAQTFGELFVETEPEGAEVLLNGLPKGRSPVVLERVPIGRVSLEARKDALYAVRELDVTSDGLLKVKLELKVSLGNLFLKSSVKDGTRVSVDGRDAGPLGTGLLENVPAGEHRIVLSGNGYLWEGTAVVQTGKTVTVEAYPREVGSVSYKLPAEVQAEITARDYRMVVRESGTLPNVPVGTYTVKVTGTDYEALTLPLEVRRGVVASLAPSVRRTEEYERRVAYDRLTRAVSEVEALLQGSRRLGQADVDRARAVEREVAASRWSFADLLGRARSAAAAAGERFDAQERGAAESAFRSEEARLNAILAGRATVTQGNVSEARSHSAAIQGSRFSFPDLAARAEAIVAAMEKRAKADALTVRRDELERRLAEVRRSRRGLLVSGGVLIGVGVAGAATGVVSYLLGREAYASYDAARYSPDAEAAWAQVGLFTTLFNVGIGTGGGGTGLGLVLCVSAPSVKGLEQELAGVKLELAGMGGTAK